MELMENQSLGGRIRTARTKAGLTQKEVGKIFDISREAVSLWENDTNAPTADKIGRLAVETQTNSEWLMTGRGDPDGHMPPPPSQPFGAEATRGLGKIPILGVGVGGSDGHCEWNGEEIDRVDRPPALADAVGAYAIYVAESSMDPRYLDGELVFVHPGRPIIPGNFVVVQFHKDEAGGQVCVWIKQFVKRGPKETIFKQLNPVKELKLPTARIVAVHRIVGTGER